MKTYTDIQQSKKLAEFLSLESADMCYCNDGTSIKIDATSYSVGVTKWKKYLVELIPCWSLAALINAIPSEIVDNHFLTLHKEGEEYCCCYENYNGHSIKGCFSDNPIDACYEMIVKLKEEGLI